MSDIEIVQEFLVESYENLDRLDRELVSLEKTPGDEKTLASIFRTIHTIKGTCGFLGFSKLEAVAHVGENLLSKLRDGVLQLKPELTTALLAMVDAVRQMLASIEASGQEGERDDAALIAKLTALLKSEPVASGAEAPGAVPNIGELLIEKAGASPSDIRLAAEKQALGDPRHMGEILVEEGAVKSTDVVEALHTQQAARAQTSVSESTIRVDVALLDKLMNLVGELVLARNQILQFSNATEDAGIVAPSQRLNLITTELQEGVMKTRMQPIGNIWSKFPRTVRDLALTCGKEVEIEMEGRETELDKTIIESIKDPLTHLVRNTVDHGIEKPEVRRAAGKNPVGRLTLRAFHEGGQVNIEISDDGAGLDCERLRRKAVEKALITPEQAAKMGERETANLIFLPGFSTAEKITNVSGRGVGMDVVKTNIERIGGTVDVQSKPGSGTTVRMKIPLTLAIIPALIVTSGGDRYASAQVDKRKAGNLSQAIRVAFRDLGVFKTSDAKAFQDGALPFEKVEAVDETELNADLKKLIDPSKGTSTGGKTQSLRDVQQAIQKALDPEIERHQVSMTMGPEGLIISLKETGFFDSGTATIRPESLDAISRLVAVLKERPEHLRIEGHTDNVPIHNSRFASNWELSASRATEMIRLLITRYGLVASHLSAAGYGEFHPIATNGTADGRAQNRRVDVVVLAPVQLADPDSGNLKQDAPPVEEPEADH
jgi:flagellar motor protein MotB/HPt (histidine-containing phosphotransfer) domain-containing protein